MDPFLNFPDELIVKICNEADTPSLLNLSVSSSKVYQVCNKIIEKRKEEYLIEKKIQNIENIISNQKEGSIYFFKIIEIQGIKFVSVVDIHRSKILKFQDVFYSIHNLFFPQQKPVFKKLSEKILGKKCNLRYLSHEFGYFYQENRYFCESHDTLTNIRQMAESLIAYELIDLDSLMRLINDPNIYK